MKLNTQNFKTTTDLGNDAKPVLVAVTPEMIKFAEEYALWIVTVGQNYINALSPKFTTESSMKIFIDNYYTKDWLEERFK